MLYTNQEKSTGLADRTAVVYGAGGAIGSAAARAFAREGAKVFLAGRTQSRLDAVVSDIVAAGGLAESAQLDALDAAAVDWHADAVAERTGRIDIALNAIGVPHVQGTPFADLSLEEYEFPIATYTRSNFITAKAVARHMAKQGSGVILTLSTPGARLPGPGYMGNCVASSAIEAMSRHLAGELGAQGIRVVCIRPHAIPEALAADSHTRQVFGPMAERAGVTIDQMLAGAASGTLLKRLPTLDQVANTAVFLASDSAGAITGTVANLSCGFLVD
jgi:3-oxoacyl-[acyl-carrier protein] reductase